MAEVRIFTYSGLVTLPTKSSQYGTDSVRVFDEPYLGRELLNPDTGTAVSSSVAISSNPRTTLARIQVENGKLVHYEVNHSERDVDASTESPIISGEVVIKLPVNGTISVLEAS